LTAPVHHASVFEMSGRGSIDEKLAPHVFVTDFVWAARAVFRQPSVALVSIALWVLPVLWTRWIHHVESPWIVAAGLLLYGLFTLGWLGVERMFFLHQRGGKSVTLRAFFATAPFFIGRFLRLGLLVSIAWGPLVVVVSHFTGGHDRAAPHASRAVSSTIALLTIMVALDVVLTFVPSALVFTTRSASRALRIGLSMIRQTWPRSGLYVLCPPLALNMLNAIYPTEIPVVAVVTTAGLALLALLAKGATAAFYLRAGSISSDAAADLDWPRV
jgi:hypothetical protein